MKTINAAVTAMPRVGLNPYALGMRLFDYIEELADRFGTSITPVRDALQSLCEDGLLTNRPDFIPLALLEWVVILGKVFYFQSQ